MRAGRIGKEPVGRPRAMRTHNECRQTRRRFFRPKEGVAAEPGWESRRAQGTRALTAETVEQINYCWTGVLNATTTPPKKKAPLSEAEVVLMSSEIAIDASPTAPRGNRV